MQLQRELKHEFTAAEDCVANYRQYLSVKREPGKSRNM